jgi:hypothetical protein
MVRRSRTGEVAKKTLLESLKKNLPQRQCFGRFFKPKLFELIYFFLAFFFAGAFFTFTAFVFALIFFAGAAFFPTFFFAGMHSLLKRVKIVFGEFPVSYYYTHFF